MLSIIIIGRNEGWKLSKCVESVFCTIKQNKIIATEVIYVDSKSTDDSLERAKKFRNLKVFRLTGDCNAAIARNVGAKMAKGDVLFFIDGDMELIPKIFSQFYTEKDGLFYPFLSGDWDNYFYNQDWKYLKKDKGLSLKKDKKRFTVGGLFFIKKNLWDLVGGMRVEFKRGEDIDLALRLAARKVLLLKKKEILVHHHMINYMDKRRKWDLLFSGADLYGRSYLYRKNFFNKYCWKRILRNDYSNITLIISVISSVITNFLLPFIIYLLILFPKTYKNKGNYLINYLYFILRDIFVIFGYIFFWPSKPKKIEYNAIITEFKNNDNNKR